MLGLIGTFICVLIANWIIKFFTGKDTLKKMDEDTVKKINKFEKKINRKK